MFNTGKSYSKTYNRIKNPKLLETIRKQPCLVCSSRSGSDPHHIKSVGSGGHDTETNVAPLCRTHHTEIHAIGLNRFSQKYVRVALWLVRNGWSYNPQNNKWREDTSKGGVII